MGDRDVFSHEVPLTACDQVHRHGLRGRGLFSSELISSHLFIWKRARKLRCRSFHAVSVRLGGGRPVSSLSSGLEGVPGG